MASWLNARSSSSSPFSHPVVSKNVRDCSSTHHVIVDAPTGGFGGGGKGGLVPRDLDNVGGDCRGTTRTGPPRASSHVPSVVATPSRNSSISTVAYSSAAASVGVMDTMATAPTTALGGGGFYSLAAETLALLRAEQRQPNRRGSATGEAGFGGSQGADSDGGATDVTTAALLAVARRTTQQSLASQRMHCVVYHK